jgi:hypothetical protein
MNALEIITFLRNNVIQGTRLKVTPYYKDNTLRVNGVFHNSNIQIVDAEIIKEKDLINTVRMTLAKPKDPMPERRRRRAVKDTLTLLEEEGFKISNIGTVYLAEAIVEVIYCPESIKLLTKVVYPDIAERYSTTVSAVERNIRFAINKVSDEPNSHYIQYWVTRLKSRTFPYF